ncbi:MAG: flippase-like domain-containing protein [Candidatus Rokubacteria bacterium]|nr:flippase-like domain-containing protein [Candidatus Rokubacteria bacterium]
MLRPLLLLAGAAFIVYLVYEVGPATVWESVRTLSWRLLLVVCFPYALTTTLDTLAWRCVFLGRAAPFWPLWGARLAGEAVNATTPTASVGGEPVKAYLLRPWVPLPEGLASVIVDKTTVVVGQGLFLVLGLLVATSLVPAASPLMTAMVLLLGLEVAGVGGFVMVQLRGPAGRGGRLLGRLGMGPGERGQERLEGLDRALAAFYRAHRRRLLAAVLFHFAAWTAGSLEIYLVLTLLGLPISLPAAVAIESFGTAVKFASFMIPASLGALEGGNVAIFAAFGLGGAAGLSYTLIRRLREAAWILVGLAAMAPLSGRQAAAGAAATEHQTRPGRPPLC